MSELTIKGQQAKEASVILALATSSQKKAVLLNMSTALIEASDQILAANEIDIRNAQSNHMSEAMIDRLKLTAERIHEIAAGVKEIAILKDPIGEVTHMWQTDEELTVGQKRVPLGVIGIIYESRPNVTVDAAALCFKTGNAVLLRGGSDAIHSNQAFTAIIQSVLTKNGFPKAAIQLIEDTSRTVVNEMMKLNQFLDVLIPRGGAKLIETVVSNATVPIIQTGTGNCHIFVDESADIEMAIKILVNAKCSRPSVCNAVETVLVHEKIAAQFLPKMEQLLDEYQCQLRADDESRKYLKKAIPATEKDWTSEFLDYILAVKVVTNIDEAISHINKYSTKHSEAIITSNYENGQKFHQQIDSAAVYINASTRFTDGNAFGFGAEIGISTQKLHARGPMGLKELTANKYIIFGDGQIR